MARMVSGAQAQLVAKANENVNGKVMIGDVEFSIFGTLIANAVTVSDRQNAVVGKSDRIAVRFGIGDVLAGRADLSAVKSVTLENPVMTLTSGKDGRWNWEDLVKTRKDQEMVFRGAVNRQVGDAAGAVGGGRAQAGGGERQHRFRPLSGAGSSI